MLLNTHGIQAYLDGMGRDVYKTPQKDPEYLKNPDLLDRAFEHAISVNDRQGSQSLKNR